MSELKAVHAFDVYEVYTKTGDDDAAQVYLKSEADEVIAELEEKIKNIRNARKHWRKEYLIEYKECLHQKFKRCLAMARWCHNQKEIYERDSYDWELEDDAKNTLRNKANIMRKWHKRWLAIAEKFKEAK